MKGLIYPSSIYCIACGNLIDKTRKYSLCDECIRKFNWVTQRSCDKCGRPLRDNQKGDRCGICNDVELAFEKGYVCVEYDDDTKEIVHHYKFNDQVYIAKVVAEIMRDKLKGKCELLSLITAVPMHKKRLRKRGYNQAEVLARELGKLIALPYEPLLARVNPTPPMSSLGIEARRLNLEEAFAMRKGQDARDKTILLIDDVLTTGSTADACARVMLDAGAKRVNLAVFAAGTSLDRDKI